MFKSQFNKRQVLVFHHFGNKGYSLFACLGREVVCSVLSVATLTYASAESVSTHPVTADSIATKTDKELMLDEVSVTGSRAPLTAMQSAKFVSVITRDDIQRAGAETVNDLLKLATGVDVRQRGGFGVQTDISINGGTFDQLTILLNGVDISNPQTGHNASDFPVGIQDIERIEVLEGAASRLFGSSAFSGAINIVTHKERASLLTAEAEGGSYGTFGAGAGVTLQSGSLHNHLSGGYQCSDGYQRTASSQQLNSDFDKKRAFYYGDWQTRGLGLSWQAGLSTQGYGANTFYSAKYDDQYEKTTHALLSVSGDVRDLPHGIHITPTLYANRFLDHYQLIRGSEGAASGENYHRMDVYGASINASIDWFLGKSAIGADVRKEHILSTAYGKPLAESDWKAISGTDRRYEREGERTNTSIFAEHNVVLDRVTISAGLLANYNTTLSGLHLYPGVDLSYRPTPQLKLYASWNQALRLPTWTDLYSNNAVVQGDASLKPERNNTVKLGADYHQRVIRVQGSVFYSRGRDMIDWVYETEDSPKYHALNIGTLDNLGFSADVHCYPAKGVHAQAGYAYIHQKHETEQPIFRSLYALEYLRHKVTVQLDHPVAGKLSAHWAMRWQQRMNGYTPYFKVDGKLQWTEPSFTLYVKADNLTNHQYYDLGGVLQPGIWVMAGGHINIKL